MQSESFGPSTKDLKSQVHPLEAFCKSKLDKAQARRLKMPKRNRSAYFLFSMDVRAKLKAELDHQLTPLETQAKVSQYWKELSHEEKEKYEAKAKEEKYEYLMAMDKFYSNLTPETLAKSQSNRPKKPCSAYAHFVRDIKTELKKENPRLIMQEILHIASEKWKNLTGPVRVAYEERARADKEAYMAATRKTLSEGKDGKSKKSLSDSELGKREQRSFETFSQESIKKQIKIESPSTKSDSQSLPEEPGYRSVKVEAHDISFTPETKSESEAASRGMFIGDLHNLGQHLNFVAPQMTNGFEMPGINESLLAASRPNMLPNMIMGAEYEKMKEMMIARLNWARLVETNNAIEDAIMKRMAEVRALQAQRLMFAQQKAFFSGNSGTF